MHKIVALYIIVVFIFEIGRSKSLTQLKYFMKNCLRIALALLLYVLSINTTPVKAQNLVVNPSFEITSSNCANLGGEGFFTDLAGSWDNASNNVGGDSCSSPDLFSACNTLPIIGGPGPTNMPSAALGFQYSHTGTRHAGIITYEALDEYREYIQGRVSSPLVAGQSYCVSMYVSLGDLMPYATNNMGIYFSNTRYLRDPCPGQTNSGIYVTPQLNYSCNAITDTSAAWVRLQWNYTAAGGETYFTIGNFFNNAGTNIVNTGQPVFPNPFAYYFIDDVSIVPNGCCFAEITARAPFCISDAPATLSVTTGTGTDCNPTLNGTWSGPGVNSSTGLFTPAVAGIGSHIISYTLPCGYTDTITIRVNACATLTACKENNNSVTVSGGTGPYTWQQQVQQQNCSGCIFPALCIPPGCETTTTTWQNFATGTNTTPASYPVRVLDSNGGELIITSAASLQNCASACALTASATPAATTCGNNNGGVTVTTTGATPTGYAWSNGATSATLTSVAAGTYTVTVSASGCTATATANVASSTGITASATSTAAGCTSTGTATANITGGTASAYSWSNGASTQTANSLAAGTYTVTVTSTANCTATASTVVGSSGGVVVSATATNATCSNANGSATVTISSGTATAYNWSNGATGATASNLTGGTYTVTVTGTGGCSATASAVVGNTGAPAITTSATAAGCNGNTGSATVTVTSGTATGYNWSSGATSATASNLAAGNYTVTVTGTGGCTVTASVTVNSSSTLSISASSTNTSCGNVNGTAAVNVTQGTASSYLWSNGATLPNLNSLAAGTYTVTVSDAGGCTATASVIVGGSGTGNVAITTDKTAICPGDSAILCAPSGYQSYLWNNGSTTDCIKVKLAGNYYVTVTDLDNCTATSPATAITAYQQPSVSISVNGDTLVAYNSSSYQWYRDGVLISGATDAIYVPSVSGSYTVVVSNAAGCTAQSLPVVVTITGINDMAKESMSVFPNPNAGSQWTIAVSQSWIGANCEVYDAIGRMVYKEEIKNEHSIVELNIAPGVYMLKVTKGNKSVSQKLIRL